jgi:hypothetical protein
VGVKKTKILLSKTVPGKFYRDGMGRLLFRLQEKKVGKVVKDFGNTVIPIEACEGTGKGLPYRSELGQVEYFLDARSFENPDENEGKIENPLPGDLVCFPPWYGRMISVVLDVKRWNEAVEREEKRKKEPGGKRLEKFPFLIVSSGSLKFLGFISLTEED